jgi:tetratricopeptide (TPR) repeat protein
VKAGTVLEAQGDLTAALKAYQDSLAIAERLAGVVAPSNVDWQRDVAVGHYKIAMVLARQGDLVQALDAFRKGRAIITKLQEQSPENAQLANDLAVLDAQIAKLEKADAAAPDAAQAKQTTQ